MSINRLQIFLLSQVNELTNNHMLSLKNKLEVHNVNTVTINLKQRMLELCTLMNTYFFIRSSNQNLITLDDEVINIILEIIKKQYPHMSFLEFLLSRYLLDETNILITNDIKPIVIIYNILGFESLLQEDNLAISVTTIFSGHSYYAITNNHRNIISRYRPLPLTYNDKIIESIIECIFEVIIDSISEVILSPRNLSKLNN